MAGHGPIVGLDNDDNRRASGQVLPTLSRISDGRSSGERTSMATSGGPWKNPRGAGDGIRSCRTNATSGATNGVGPRGQLEPDFREQHARRMTLKVQSNEHQQPGHDLAMLNATGLMRMIRPWTNSYR